MKLRIKSSELTPTHPWRIARGGAPSTHPVFHVELQDQDGIIGRGESAPSARYGESVQSGVTFLNQLDLNGIDFQNLHQCLAWLETLPVREMSARCALNLAILDGVGKRARGPVYEMLDLGFREGQHVTSFSIGIDTPEVTREKVIEASHYSVLKLKVGVPGDLENLIALREVAPDKPIRLDANEGWPTKEEALEQIERLAKYHPIQFIEQPMPALRPVVDWTWLKARSPLPIFADESYHTAKDIERCAECFHGVNVKLVKSGGISGGFAALKSAKGAGLQTMLGCMLETSVLVTAAAHLAELCDYLDLDGNLLISNDPFAGVQAPNGILSFAQTQEQFGLRVQPR
jgi:L-Ala-D/L-Glu epimerase